MARNARSTASPTPSISTPAEPEAVEASASAMAPRTAAVETESPDVPDLLAPWMRLWSQQLEMWMAGIGDVMDRQQTWFARWLDWQEEWQRAWQRVVLEPADVAAEPVPPPAAAASVWFDQAQTTLQAWTRQWADAWNTSVSQTRH